MGRKTRKDMGQYAIGDDPYFLPIFDTCASYNGVRFRHRSIGPEICTKKGRQVRD